jgi:hypothetical protein
VFVALAKIQVYDLHWCCFANATPRDDLIRCIKISSQQEFGVRHDNSEASAETEDTIYLLRQPLSILKRKVFHHMFAENAVERLTGERERPAEVDQVMNVLITKPVDIHPEGVVNTPWTGTEIQE